MRKIGRPAWRRKVAADARRARQRDEPERRDNIDEYFAATYDRPRGDVEFEEEPNVDRFVLLPDLEHLYGPHGGHLSPAALAVYPVLCLLSDYTDDEEPFHESVKRLGQWAGMSENTTRKAIKELAGATMVQRPDSDHRVPLLSREIVVRDRRRIYLYWVAWTRPRDYEAWKAASFMFPGEIVHSGRWAAIGSRAKALFLAACSEARFSDAAYEALEGVDLSDYETRGTFYQRHYKQRKWEVCETPWLRLAEIAGVNSSNLKTAKAELERQGLLQEARPNKRDRVLQVILRPVTHERDQRRARLQEELG